MLNAIVKCIDTFNPNQTINIPQSDLIRLVKMFITTSTASGYWPVKNHNIFQYSNFIYATFNGITNAGQVPIKEMSSLRVYHLKSNGRLCYSDVFAGGDQYIKKVVSKAVPKAEGLAIKRMILQHHFPGINFNLDNSTKLIDFCFSSERAHTLLKNGAGIDEVLQEMVRLNRKRIGKLM